MARLASFNALVIVLSLVLAISISILSMDKTNASRVGALVEQNLDNIEWWKKSTYYHIYVRSFKDSNGDGNGDLRGVIEKLDYLQKIGVGTLLMSPFYSSPMKDGGYDIDNYVDINPMFGTMQDFEDLIVELKRRSMRIVVDFVPNHSSNKHKWFELSENSVGKYKDYYVWSSSTRYQGKYPSNWISVFGGGPAWSWSEKRKEFYLHQFLPEQPDLNFRNPDVREEFKEIARFWLRKGVDGLRLDAAIYLFEDTINFADEPPNIWWKEGDDPCEKLHHIHTRCLPESCELIRDWRQVTEEPEFRGQAKVLIPEAYDSIPNLLAFHGKSPEDRFADMPFNFELMQLKEANLTSESVERFAMNWIGPNRAMNWPDEHGAMSPWIIWVTGNHDNKRLANRIGLHNIQAFKWITYMLPGAPVNYYGDELPLHDSNFNTIPQRTIDEGEPTRLRFRAPMAWDSSSPSAGFSSSSNIWMPLNVDHKTNNVERLLSPFSDPFNHLKLHLRLEKLRQDYLSLFVFGDLVFYRNFPDESTAILALARVHENFGNLLLLVNFDPKNLMVVRLRENYSVIWPKLIKPPRQGQVVLLNYEEPIEVAQLRGGKTVSLENLIMAPSQAALIRF